MMAAVPVHRHSLAPEPPPEAVRALLATAAEAARICLNCGMPFTGRAAKRACSARCRAAMSRQRQSEAQAARDAEVLALVSKAHRLLDKVRSLLTRPAEENA